MKEKFYQASVKRRIVKPSLKKRCLAFIRQNKKYQARVEEDDEWQEKEPTRPIVRILVVILILHIIVIGGIWIRGSVVKSGVGIPPQQISSKDALIGKTETSSTGVVAPIVNGILPAVSGVTEAPASPIGALPALPVETREQSLSVEIVDEPAFNANGAPLGVTPITPPVPSGANMSVGTVKHLVSSGETWETIARDYGCSTADLHKSNPQLQLRSNVTVVIPPPPGMAAKIAAQEVEASSGKIHVIKSGDTLSRVARIHKTTVQKLMEINGFKTNKEAGRLKIGQEIKLP